MEIIHKPQACSLKNLTTIDKHLEKLMRKKEESVCVNKS